MPEKSLSEMRADLAFSMWLQVHRRLDNQDRDEYERLMYEFAFQYITGMNRAEYFAKHSEKVSKGWTPRVSVKQFGGLCKVFCIGFQRVTGRYAKEVD